MRLKSFTGENMTAAMAAVRAELGDEAIIIATHEEDAGQIRVTAAVDDSPEIDAALAEADESEVVDRVYQAFRDHGLPAAVGEPLLDAIEGSEETDARAALAMAFEAHFRFEPFGDAPWHRPLMPVGPPGAGKTQTVAKLAATALLRGRRVALMTTDTDRTAGLTHLSAFAERMNLAPMEIETPRDLLDAITAASGNDLILIDSAGRNHLSVEDMGELSGFLLEGRIEPFLVLPAGTDAVEAGDIAASYHALGVRRLVVTRLDMTRRLGSILAAASIGNLALAELGVTPRIKDGLAPASARTLARLLVPDLGRATEHEVVAEPSSRKLGVGR